MNNVKQKKLLLVLPLLALPFLTMAFWALGGGNESKKVNVIKGLNLDLPDAKLKDDKGLDKLSFYDQADKDSEKLQELMRNDPYFKKDTLSFSEPTNELEELTNTTATKYNQHLNLSLDENKGSKPEDEILKKLELLKTNLNQPEITQKEEEQKDTVPKESSKENVMDDPEMKQLDGTLDKILDIQHPERIKERKEILPKKSYRVETKVDTAVAGFYGYSSEEEKFTENSIAAVIADNQSLVNGSVIKLRLTDDIFINDVKVPAGNLVYGTVALHDERLEVEITSIKFRKSVLNVKLEVYDMDGLPGIYIPGAISRDVAKEGMNNSLQLMELTSVDPSLKAQATAAGIGTIKNLLSKKVKLTRVMVKAGYKVLLKNKNQNQ